MVLMELQELKTRYDKVIQEQEDLIRENGRQALLSGVRELFNKFPEIIRIGWKFYDDGYYDDGYGGYGDDRCEIHEFAYEIKEAPERQPTPEELRLVAEKIEKKRKIFEAQNEVRRLKGQKLLVYKEKPAKPKKKRISTDDDFYSWCHKTDNKELKREIDEFKRSLSGLESIVQILFGDRHRVIIYNDAELRISISDVEDFY